MEKVENTGEKKICSEDESKKLNGGMESKTALENENEEKSLEIDSSSDDQKENSTTQVNRSNGVKRTLSASSDSSSVPSKKVRNKPKPQIIENMKEYVDSNTAEKLTTATLRHWLKERSVHCTTRDKKADLIEKICKHFLTEST